MLNKELVREIEENLFGLFDLYSVRYFADYSEDSTNPKRVEEFSLEQAFLIKRASEPGFMRFVLSRMDTSEIIKRYRSLMAGFLLIQIAAKLGGKRLDSEATVNKLLELLKKRDGKQRYTRRQVYNIIGDYFKDFFFEPDKELKTRDDREAVVSSVLAPQDMPYNPFTQDSVDFIQYDRKAFFANDPAFDAVEFNSFMRIVTPEHYAGLIEFRRDCSKSLEHIDTKTDVRKYLKSLINDFDKLIIFEPFYNHLNSILALYWFKKRRDDSKPKLLIEDYTLKIKKEDVKKSLELSKTVLGEERYLAPFLQVTNSMINNRMYDEERIIYEAMIEDPKLDPQTYTQIIDNLGIVYRELGKYKKMISFSKEALPLFENKDHYRHGLILKNIGEANYMLNRKERCFKLFNEAEEVIENNGSPEEKIQLLFNLAASCGRIDEKTKGRKYINKILNDPKTSADILDKVDLLLEKY